MRFAYETTHLYNKRGEKRMEKITITFDKAIPKKHSIRYTCTDKEAAVSDIYVKRSALPAVYPEKIKITLEQA